MNEPNTNDELVNLFYRKKTAISNESKYTMKKQLTKISIKQSSKIAAALYVVIGLLYTLIGIPMIIFGGEELKVMGIVYLLMPVIMGIFGYIFFAIFCAIYNALARKLGGIEVEVTNVD